MDKTNKKQNNSLTRESLAELSKEELIEKCLTLQAHNLQLKNIIYKSTATDNEKPVSSQKPFDFSRCQFRHILLKFYYLGWDYRGYAIQEDTTNTIEYHLFKALTRTCLIKDRSSSNYHRCGRTDKGVSSFSQTISIDVRSKLSKDNQHNLDQEIDYCTILNKVLPEHIQCIAWSPATENFSARFDCTSRTYKYFFPRGNLSIPKMITAVQYLLGAHDFRNFCKMDIANGVVEFTRNILDVSVHPVCSCDELEHSEYCIYVVTIRGKAFLWHQIRCIMGVLLLIGQQKEEPEVISELLDINKNPRKPDYGLASEIPLNLYDCKYDCPLNWYYSPENLKYVLFKLKSVWTFHAIKSAMVRSMFNDTQGLLLKVASDVDIADDVLTDCLIQGTRSKTYIPLLKRPKCESLEYHMEQCRKKSKVDLSSSENSTLKSM